jgi:hypothetical protein
MPGNPRAWVPAGEGHAGHPVPHHISHLCSWDSAGLTHPTEHRQFLGPVCTHTPITPVTPVTHTSYTRLQTLLSRVPGKRPRGHLERREARIPLRLKGFQPLLSGPHSQNSTTRRTSRKSQTSLSTRKSVRTSLHPNSNGEKHF